MKLRNLFTPFKVGLVALLGIVAMLVMVVRLTGEGIDSGDEQIRVHAYFDDVTGLAENSRIRMAGIAVGQITDISLAGRQARVEVSVRDDVTLYKGVQVSEDYWKNGAALAKRQASFIGDYFLELTPGTEGPVLEDGDEIENVLGSPGIEQIFSRLDRITEDIEKVTDSLATVFGDEKGQRSMDQILTDLQQILETVRIFVGANAQTLDRILADAEVIGQEVRQFTEVGTQSASAILRDAEAIVQEVRYIVGQSSEEVQEGIGTLTGTLTRLQSTLDSLNYSLQNIQDITDKVNQGEGTLGVLVNDPTIANKTEEILSDAGELIGTISNLRTIIQLRSEYHVRNRAFKNVFGLKIQPRRNKFYLIELVDDYRGNTSIVTEDVNTTNAGSADGVYRETTVTTSDSFRISIQYGQTFDLAEWLAVTGRFGLIESSGGIGTNLMFFDDETFNIQTDLYDFGFAVNPRLRTFAMFNFVPFAFAVAGVDDVFNPGARDFFIGAGIRFDDDDLKAILAITGAPSTGN